MAVPEGVTVTDFCCILKEAVFKEGELCPGGPHHLPGVPGGPGAVAVDLLCPEGDPLDVLDEVVAALVPPRQDFVRHRVSRVPPASAQNVLNLLT